MESTTNAQIESYTRLHGRRLLIARLTWIAIALLATIMHIASLPVAFDLIRTPCYQEPCATPFQTPSETEGALQEEADLKGAWQSSILEATAWLLTLGVALLIFWRRSDDWIAHLASIMLVTILAPISPWPEMLADARPLWHWPRALLWGIGLASAVGLFYLFPDGRFVPRWTRGLVIVLLFVIAALTIAGAPFLAGFPIFVVALGTGTVFQIYRYQRVSDPIQRQQTKWVVLGIIGMVLPLLVVLLVAFLNPSLNPLLSSAPRSPQADNFFGLMVSFGIVIPLCFLPVTLAFSILRYRLWDVDILINRTMVYGVLTTSIVGLYVLVVGGLGAFLQTQDKLPDIVIAVSLIAFLFQPLHRSLQGIANRFVPVSQTVINQSISATELKTEQVQKVLVTDSAPNTIVHGRWLPIVRWAWVAWFITLTVMYVFGFLAVHEALSTVCNDDLCTLSKQIRHTEAGEQVMDWGGPPEGFADPLRSDQVKVLEPLGLTLDQYGWLGALQLGIPALVYLLIAGGLFWWKSDDWMVLFASTMVMTLPFVDMPLPYSLLVRQPIWQWIYIPADFVAVSSFFIFPLVFPTGQFVPRWTRWKVWFDIAFAIYDTLSRNYILKLPPGLEDVTFLYIILSFVTNAYAQSYRYSRVASPVERQQIKWVVVGVVGFISIAFAVDRFLYYHPIIIDSARALLLSVIPDTIYRAITLFIPVSIAISVLRYRLWDINILINRTLVYGALTASIIGLYVLVVGGLGTFLQTQSNLPGIVIAALLIAFLFQPLHRGLQGIANRFVPISQTVINQSILTLVLKTEQAQKVLVTDSAPNTIVHGRWLPIVRWAWVTAFIALTLMYAFSVLAVHEALSTVCDDDSCTLKQQIRHTARGDKVISWLGPNTGYADRLRPDQVEALETLGLTLEQYGWLGALQMGIPVLVYLLIAAGLFSRKSDDWMVLFVSTMVMTFPLVVMPLLLPLVVRQPVWQWVFTPADLVSFWLFLIFPLVFPNGQFVPRWTRWKVWFDFAFIVISHSILPEPPAADNFRFAYSFLSFCISAYALSYRYFRVASPVERQQIKWVVAGLVGFVIIGVPLDALVVSQAANTDLARGLVQSAIADTLFQAIALFIPLSIAISVLRYRLWDIDVLINRTVVYGTLTAGIIGIYVLVVGVLGTTIQERGNLLVSILTTGLIAVMAQPLRDRLQRGVNRLLYGERDDPVTVLSRLGQRLEATLAPDAVLPSLVETVAQTLKLPYVAIETRNTRLDSQPETDSASINFSSPIISYGAPQLDVIRLPLIYQSETIGQLVVAPRAQDEALSPMDRHLLENIAHQAGMALHAVSLTADLQLSRQRLVTTREEERRRLRRDLHDGLGPNLASQGLKLAAVKQLLENNPTAAVPLLDQVMSQNKSTVDDVRRLVYGLRPPALDELGLVAAIRDHVAGMDGKSTLQIEITEPSGGLPMLSAAVEVAAYRIALEALTNVIRHAQASHCTIRFSTKQNDSIEILQIEVIDNGIGLLGTHHAGVGTRSMRERAEELGGSCVIESMPNGGTRVRAQLPIIKESAHVTP